MSIKIYSYAGWRNYGVRELDVEKISRDGKTAYSNNEKFIRFELTKQKAIIKVKKIIENEIKVHKKSIKRLREIGKNYDEATKEA